MLGLFPDGGPAPNPSPGMQVKTRPARCGRRQTWMQRMIHAGWVGVGGFGVVVLVALALVALVIALPLILLGGLGRVLYEVCWTPVYEHIYVRHLGWLHLKLMKQEHKMKWPYQEVPGVIGEGGVTVRVFAIPYLEDNYAYLVVVDAAKAEPLRGVIVDCGEAEKIFAGVRAVSAHVFRGRPIDVMAILTTHHHWDHMSGNRVFPKLMFDHLSALPPLQREFPPRPPSACEIYSGAMDHVVGTTIRCEHGDVIEPTPGLLFEVIFAPCHTQGHLLYYLRCSERPNWGGCLSKESGSGAGGGGGGFSTATPSPSPLMRGKPDAAGRHADHTTAARPSVAKERVAFSSTRAGGAGVDTAGVPDKPPRPPPMRVVPRGEGVLFSGDTLFFGGCGATFEGSSMAMTRNHATILQKCSLKTLVYSGHEYSYELLSKELTGPRACGKMASFYNTACHFFRVIHQTQGAHQVYPLVVVGELLSLNEEFRKVYDLGVLLMQAVVTTLPAHALDSGDRYVHEEYTVWHGPGAPPAGAARFSASPSIACSALAAQELLEAEPPPPSPRNRTPSPRNRGVEAAAPAANDANDGTRNPPTAVAVAAVGSANGHESGPPAKRPANGGGYGNDTGIGHGPPDVAVAGGGAAAPSSQQPQDKDKPPAAAPNGAGGKDRVADVAAPAEDTAARPVAVEADSCSRAGVGTPPRSSADGATPATAPDADAVLSPAAIPVGNDNVVTPVSHTAAPPPAQVLSLTHATPVRVNGHCDAAASASLMSVDGVDAVILPQAVPPAQHDTAEQPPPSREASGTSSVLRVAAAAPASAAASQGRRGMDALAPTPGGSERQSIMRSSLISIQDLFTSRHGSDAGRDVSDLTRGLMSAEEAAQALAALDIARAEACLAQRHSDITFGLHAALSAHVQQLKMLRAQLPEGALQQAVEAAAAVRHDPAASPGPVPSARTTMTPNTAVSPLSMGLMRVEVDTVLSPASVQQSRSAEATPKVFMTQAPAQGRGDAPGALSGGALFQAPTVDVDALHPAPRRASAGGSKIESSCPLSSVDGVQRGQSLIFTPTEETPLWEGLTDRPQRGSSSDGLRVSNDTENTGTTLEVLPRDHRKRWSTSERGGGVPESMRNSPMRQHTKDITDVPEVWEEPVSVFYTKDLCSVERKLRSGALSGADGAAALKGMRATHAAAARHPAFGIYPQEGENMATILQMALIVLGTGPADCEMPEEPHGCFSRMACWRGRGATDPVISHSRLSRVLSKIEVSMVTPTQRIIDALFRAAVGQHMQAYIAWDGAARDLRVPLPLLWGVLEPVADVLHPNTMIGRDVPSTSYDNRIREPRSCAICVTGSGEKR